MQPDSAIGHSLPSINLTNQKANVTDKSYATLKSSPIARIGIGTGETHC